MMRNRSGNGLVCTYCGREINSDEEICECGKVGYVRDWDGDYSFDGLNDIDNILEDKRKRSGCYSSK